METSQSGGPSGDSRSRNAVRQGQLDWVSAVRNAEELQRWMLKFKFGAEMYLSEDIYPVEKKRETAWMNAILRAADLGGFKELEDLLLLFHENGVKCEELLESIKTFFLPTQDAEKEKASNELLSFQRGSLSLREAVRTLSVKLLECGRHNYKPDQATIELRYKNLLAPNEKVHFPTYLAKVDPQVRDTVKRTIAAIEVLSIELDTTTLSSNHREVPSFAGGAFPKRDKTIRRKGLHKPKEIAKDSAQTASKKTKCTRCGYDNCKSLEKGQTKELCTANGKKCNVCGKTGHFSSMCRSRSKQAVAGAAADADAVGF